MASRAPAAGVAHEHGNLRLGNRGDARFAHQLGDAVVAGYGVSVFRQVVQRHERVRLAATELGDEREHRRRVAGSPGEPAQHHARVFA
jgi:hypothetical protein